MILARHNPYSVLESRIALRNAQREGDIGVQADLKQRIAVAGGLLERALEGDERKSEPVVHVLRHMSIVAAAPESETR